jgi:ABC-type multidrug transport system permease subunit
VDLIQSIFTVLLMAGVGFLVGFRIHQGIGAALLAVVLAMLSAFAFSWIAMYVGLLSGTPEAAQSGGLIWMFPLSFVSSAFVPLQSMPSWLQPVAEWNPITAMVDSVRGLSLGTLPTAPSLETSLLRAGGWIIVLVAVFMPLAVRTFRRVGP